MEFIKYIFEKEDRQIKVSAFLTVIFQGLLIIGNGNSQKIILGLKQIPLLNIFLENPFLYLYLFICWSYLTGNLIKFYKNRKIALSKVLDLKKRAKEETTDMEWLLNYANFIKNFDKTEQKLEQIKRTLEFSEEVEKEIKSYIKTIFFSTLCIYIILFILILIEPINIKSYYSFLAHILGNSFFVGSLIYTKKNLTDPYDKIGLEYNLFSEKVLQNLNQDKR